MSTYLLAIGILADTAYAIYKKQPCPLRLFASLLAIIALILQLKGDLK